MKKIMFIILTITAMSFGCRVGGDWCVTELSCPAKGCDGKSWGYGGPSADVAKLLYDPCRGNPILAIEKSERGEWSDYKEQYTIWCETGNDRDAVHRIVITPKAV